MADITQVELQCRVDDFLDFSIEKNTPIESSQSYDPNTHLLTAIQSANTVTEAQVEALGKDPSDQESFFSPVTKFFTSLVSDPKPNTKDQPMKNTKVEGKMIDPYNGIIKKGSVLEPYDIIGGADLSVFMMIEFPASLVDAGLPNELQKKNIHILELDSVLSISYNTIRERHPIRTIGRINPVKYLGGLRTIAGNIAFNIFTEDILSRLRGKMKEQIAQIKSNFGNYSTDSEVLSKDAEERKAKWLWEQQNLESNPLMDEKVMLLDSLPEFNLLIMGTNERGTFVKFMIKGVSIIDENQYQGMQQPNIVNRLSYAAIDLIPMHSVVNSKQVSVHSVDSIDESIINGTYNRTTHYNTVVSGSTLLDELDSDIKDKR